MRGDYTRFSFEPRKRYASVQQQQGRVQLDSDWNEAEAIARRRVRMLGLDLFGPVGIGSDTTPDAFKITPIVGPPADLGITPGRIYLDGLLAECFAEDTASYLKQPFLPDPPALPTGDALVYLDVWEREVTWVQDKSLLDPALGGRDTATRLQTVWQVKVTAQPGAVCGMPVGAPASAGRLTSSAIAPPTPDDPCLLPPVAGYRGLENRLYRVEIHAGGTLGTARFKWSRDNGSIVSAVSSLTVAGGQTQLAVNRVGRDAVMGFAIGDWVTVTDDFRELAEEPGEMAQIIDVQPATNGITLDRALPSAGARPFGANPTDIAARHTRIQRWDQTAATNTLDTDGLITTAAGPLPLEDGVQVELTLDPASGMFNTGDWWVFAARVATASVEILDKAPPRGTWHHYVQLAAITGLGGTSPIATDCRPAKIINDNCCCTVVVAVGQDIQKAIDSLPNAGGCVCLRAGRHIIEKTLIIKRGNIKLEGESPGTTVSLRAEGPVLVIEGQSDPQRVVVSGIDFERSITGGTPAVLFITRTQAVRIDRCVARGNGDQTMFGIIIEQAEDIAVTDCRMEGTGGAGIWVSGEGTQNIVLTDNIMTFDQPISGPTVQAIFGILSQEIWSGLDIYNNIISGVVSGIVVNDTPGAAPFSLRTQAVQIVGNTITLEPVESFSVGNNPVIFGVDLTSSVSIVQRNRINLPRDSAMHAGIRLTGLGTRADGNTIVASPTASGFLPIGILAGYSGTGAATLATKIRVTDNFIFDCPIGIALEGVVHGQVADNTITTNQPASSRFGAFLYTSIGIQFEANKIDQYTIGIAASTGIDTDITQNGISNGGTGILLLSENGAAVADNRVSLMTGEAIGGMALIGHTDLVGNQLANCVQSGGTATININIAAGPLRIAGNEILDTGVSATGNTAPVYGIRAMLILEASVESNRISYTAPYGRDPTAEDRALLMQGLAELTPSPTGPVTGYPIQIIANNFTGTGWSALVELRENKINDFLNQRFERVMFTDNYCEHVVAPAPPASVATVKLVGRIANVSSNHIKSQIPLASVDFGGMPGIFATNVINGPAINHSNTPAPDAGLNVIY